MAARRGYRRRPRLAPRPEDTQDQERALEVAARELAARLDRPALQELVAARRQECEIADQNAVAEPGPQNLSRYRQAVRLLAEAERALRLSERG